jgi:CPA1 family monovalent cation:H+ antiporter
MGIVEGVVALSIFLIALCALEHYTRNSRLPYVCWVLLAGLAYGVLSRTFLLKLPPMQKLLSPDIVFYIFLPLLIFDSSRKLDLKASKEVAVPSFLLATVGIVLNMFVMASLIYAATRLFGISIGWMDLLLLCGIMSATDPVAVGTVFKVFPIPEKLRMLIEGESLLNDGTTVILFMLLSKMVLGGESIHLLSALGIFSIAILGAVLIGIAFGAAGSWLLRRWNALSDHFIAPLLPLLFCYLAFALAQATFDISGLVAVMAETITFRIIFNRLRPEEIPAEEERERYRGLWDFLADLANVFLFFVLGVEMGIQTATPSFWVVPAGIIALLLARSATVYTLGALFLSAPKSWLHVLNIGGLRGALCAALVLMIPHNYPYRNIFLYLALCMSLFTLIVNPLVMRGYLKKADLSTN